MLLDAAVGDALGSGFEFNDENQKYNDLSRYVPRTSNIEHWPVTGHYSDDTQQSLALAELLVNNIDFTPINIASKFVEVFKRDPIPGYARRFYDFLRQTPDGETFLKNIKPDSDRSGAAMRATPLGVISDIKTVLEMAEIQAKVTHNTPDGIRAAQASALCTHYFLHVDHDPTYLPVFIASTVEHGNDYEWTQDWNGPVGLKGWQSTLAAINAIAKYRSQAECLKACIAYTGDVDTVATIAMAATSCCTSYLHDLPKHLYDNLTNHKYGRDYIIELDKELMFR